jgi:hypothetical protein
MSQVGLGVWLSNWIDAALKPRRASDGHRLLLLTATPAALVLGVLLLRHASHRGIFNEAPSAFGDAGAA